MSVFVIHLSWCISVLVIHGSLGDTANPQPEAPSTWDYTLYIGTANPTWGDIFESSKLKARTSLLPRFSEKRRWSFELWALKQHSKMSPQVGLAVALVSLLREMRASHERWEHHTREASFSSHTCLYIYMFTYTTTCSNSQTMRFMFSNDESHHSFDAALWCVCKVGGLSSHLNKWDISRHRSIEHLLTSQPHLKHISTTSQAHLKHISSTSQPHLHDVIRQVVSSRVIYLVSSRVIYLVIWYVIYLTSSTSCHLPRVIYLVITRHLPCDLPCVIYVIYLVWCTLGSTSRHLPCHLPCDHTSSTSSSTLWSTLSSTLCQRRPDLSHRHRSCDLPCVMYLVCKVGGLLSHLNKWDISRDRSIEHLHT